MALEIPWQTLKMIIPGIDQAFPDNKVKSENKNIPVTKIFFLPIMSLSLPKGSKNAAVARE
ncbi:MAG TPA: hypothetical protein VGJ93_06760 [Desulfuromonadaceae bacterium]